MDKGKRITFRELVWLFVLGCILGFILETIWYFIKHGVWINKQGLLYGPFKPIYGFGLLIVVITMYKFRDKKVWQKFLIGVLIGSLFEYAGSLFQEYVFGTSTWSYASFNYNIGGRIYLPYCLAWGVIALLAIDFLYPWLKKVFRRVPETLAKILTIVMAVFMGINVSLTAIATIRYSVRAQDNPKINAIYKLIDETYNDEYMRRKFPKLKVIKNN